MLSRMFPMATHRRVRLATLVGLALVHAVVLTWFARVGLSPDRQPLAPPHLPLVIQLLSGVQPSLQKQATAQAPPKSKASGTITPAPPRVSTITLTPGNAPDSTPVAPDAPPPPIPPVEPAAPAQAEPPALNLALPRAASAAWRQRPAPMDDPRANSAKATFESRRRALDRRAHRRRPRAFSPWQHLRGLHAITRRPA
jgi:type IV secretory pathway VirB10-like protein